MRLMATLIAAEPALTVGGCAPPAATTAAGLSRR